MYNHVNTIATYQAVAYVYMHVNGFRNTIQQVY